MTKGLWQTLKRLILILSLSIVTAVLALALIVYSHNTRLERQFRLITTGMSKEEVLSTMGKPNSIGKCGEGDLVPNGCYREYDYRPLLDIGTLAVFFDSNGRVVGKYDYESP